MAVRKDALGLHPNFRKKTAQVLVGSGRAGAFPVVTRRIVYNIDNETRRISLYSTSSYLLFRR